MKIIREISFDEMAHQFLAAEWYESVFDGVRASCGPVIANPDFGNPAHCQIIRHLLDQRRGLLLNQVPTTTRWLLVELEDGEFDNLLIIREQGWEATFGARRTMQAVAVAIAENDAQDVGGVGFPKIRAIKDSIGKQAFHEKLIAITRSLDGPHTVIEGNHRGVAFSMKAHLDGVVEHFPRHMILGLLPENSDCMWLNHLI